MYTVYIVQSLKDRKYYIGYTNNLDRRIDQHNIGLTTSLKNRLPVQLIYKEEFEIKSEAIKREKQIKSYKGGEAFRRLLARY